MKQLDFIPTLRLIPFFFFSSPICYFLISRDENLNANKRNLHFVVQFSKHCSKTGSSCCFFWMLVICVAIVCFDHI